MATEKSRRNVANRGGTSVPAADIVPAMKLRITKLRTERNLTIEALARMAGMSRSYLSEIESGKKQINAKRLQSLAAALHVQPIDLIDNESVPPDTMDHLRVLMSLRREDQLSVMRHAAGLPPRQEENGK